MALWTVIAKKADFSKIASHFGIDPVVARVIRNRDIISMEDIAAYLDRDGMDMHDPMLLNDMDRAVSIILEEIKKDTHIRIIGDYDVDGVTSTCILVKGLKRLGANVDYAIPNRVTDGYGINESLVERAIEAGVGMIITCDNGIAASEPLKLAMEAGLRCIVTDHHEVPYVEENGERHYIIPQVDAVVNPKRPDSTYPFQGICGAMVAYKLILALYKQAGIDDENLTLELRELAGLGTVCDVMELKDENRTVVKAALRDMAHSHNRGLQALIKVCEVHADDLAAYHLGFIIGPCINATGRLDDATLSLELLLDDNPDSAVVRASELRRYNDLRKAMTDRGLEDAYEAIEREGLADDRVMVVYLPELHESLAGIVAGRIREKYYRPVFVITRTEEGLKGSGRSIEGYHMYDALVEVGNLLDKFGGHAMAAGLSLAESRLEEFRRSLNANCRLTDDELQERVHIDVPMPVGYVTERLIDDLELLEPYGNGNPKPVFAQKDAILLSARRMGKNGNMARIIFTTKDGGQYEAVIFRRLGDMETLIESRYGSEAIDNLYKGPSTASEPIYMDLIYTPGINEFRGRRTIQFTINDFKLGNL